MSEEREAYVPGPRKNHPKYKKFFDSLASGKKPSFVAAQLRAETGKPAEFLDFPNDPAVPQNMGPQAQQALPRKLDPRYKMYFDLLTGGQVRSFVEQKLRQEQGKAAKFLDEPDLPADK
ncbi:Conserved_hypothetical protein [Hexamita inflata]|uniref:Uncharacterized protein n=1 Tax=Hexamita inflata TaxID=28002 RepID=A0AA86U7W7_9EUKA|nr:Conserved hypothetical protein [Hexamita inflata]